MLKIKFKYILVASFFLLWLHLHLGGHNYVPGDSLNILSGDIPLMKDSAPNSEKLGDAPYGAKVLIIKKTNLPFQREGIQGYWVKVKLNGQTGFLFDGYLTKLPVPPLDCRNLEDYVSTQFGKPGKLYQKVVVDNGPGEDPRMKRWQSYGPKATWVEEELYESVATSIILKNATLQEAFLIGRLCAGEYEPYLYEPLKTKPFTLKAPKLVKYAFKSTDAFVMGFSVKSLSKGTVQITMEIGI